MSKGMKAIIGVVLALVLLGAPLISSYNSLVVEESNVEKAWSDIDNKLQRRNDLIPNLVNAVQGAMDQEDDVFIAIADARANIGKADTVEESMAANNQMTSAVTNLIAVTESYPELKSNENVTRLMDELAGTENRISTERGRYNETVQKYNNKVKRFPTSVIAGMLGFDEKPYFEADEDARENPEVNFN